MKKCVLALIGLLFILIQPGGMSWAQNAYVTDSIKITLRTGPSIENKILAMLSSGKQVQVLDTLGEWNHVQITEDGEARTGWLLSRYLMTRAPYERQAEALLKENKRLRERLSPIEKTLREKTDQEKKLSRELENTSKALKSMEERYEALKREAADYLSLKKTHTATRSELERTRENFESLTSRYENLKSSQQNRWFMAGAGVLFSGFFLGLIFGRREKKRKSSYY